MWKQGHSGFANIATRGELTAAVCSKVGVACLPLGCPSFMYNHVVNVGVMVEEKWHGLVSRLNYNDGTRIKLILTVPVSPVAGIFDFFISLILKHDVTFILQTPRDLHLLTSMKSNNEETLKDSHFEIKYFYSADDWAAEVRHADLVFSCRIHGSMAAVMSGVPFFVVATDYRIVELAEAMKIPYWDSLKMTKETEKFDLRKFVNNVKFNGRAFDMNRYHAAAKYRDMLLGAGLEINPSIEILANLAVAVV